MDLNLSAHIHLACEPQLMEDLPGTSSWRGAKSPGTFDCLTLYMNKQPDRFCLTERSFLSDFFSKQDAMHAYTEDFKSPKKESWFSRKKGALIQLSNESSAAAFQKVIVARSRATGRLSVRF